MKNILKTILGVFEYISLFIVGYYGIKYAFVAGPIYFGSTAGIIVSCAVCFLFIFHILKKEGVIKL